MIPIRLFVLAAACASLAACSNPNERSGTVASPRLDSGITSSNGGGTRALGDTPGINIGPNGSQQTGAPNQKGTAY